MNELDNNDATYSYAKMAVFSSIVPLLGIINACLPIIRPALRTRKRSPTTTRRTRSIRTDGSQFERLEEPQIPLVEFSTKSNNAV